MYSLGRQTTSLPPRAVKPRPIRYTTCVTARVPKRRLLLRTCHRPVASLGRSALLAASTLLSLVLSMLGAPAARAEDRLFTSARYPLRFSAPIGWQLSDQTGYPGLLAVLTQAPDARITVATIRQQPPRTASQLGLDSLAGLRTYGLQIIRSEPAPRGGFVIDAVTPDGQRRLRQMYLVVGEVGYVFTLAGPAKRFVELQRSFDELLRDVTFEKGSTPPAT